MAKWQSAPLANTAPTAPPAQPAGAWQAAPATQGYIDATNRRTDRIARIKSALDPKVVEGMSVEDRLQLLNEVEAATDDEIAAAQTRQQELAAKPEIVASNIGLVKPSTDLGRPQLGGAEAFKPAAPVVVPGAPTQAEREADLSEKKTKDDLRRMLDPRHGEGGATTALRNAVDAFTLGGAAKISAAADAALGSGQPGETFSDRYAKNLKEERATEGFDQIMRPGASAAGQIAGTLGGGYAMAKSGLSLGGRAIEAGKGLGAVTLGSAADGALLAGAHSFNSNDGSWGEKLWAGAGGALTGLVLGGVIPPVAALVKGAGSYVTNPILSRLAPQKFANSKLVEALKRSGKSIDDITGEVSAAARDGQGAYMVADALGNPGRRALSTAARTPNDARAMVVEALENRQAGQGRRIVNALQDASGTDETAAQAVNRLTGLRSEQATENYGALPFDAPLWSKDLEALTSRPSVRSAINDAANIAAERGYSVTNPFIKGAEGGLTLPDGTMPNFRFWETVKRGLDQQIARDPANRDLIATKNALMSIMDREAPEYAAARAPFAATSREIEAVDKGRNAAMRGRPEDTIPAFRVLAPGEQQGHRVGYYDALIGDVQKAAPGVNKARPLLNDATKAEMPAFSAPGKDPTARLERENAMFETRNAATGGSKSLDNAADALDMAKIDPGAIASLLRLDVVGAAGAAGKRFINELSGNSPKVVERVAKALLETNPNAARAVLTSAVESGKLTAGRRAVLNALLENLSANHDLESANGRVVRALMGPR